MLEEESEELMLDELMDEELDIELLDIEDELIEEELIEELEEILDDELRLLLDTDELDEMPGLEDDCELEL